MGALELFLWILLGLLLQAAVLPAIAFRRHWRTYQSLRHGRPDDGKSLPQATPAADGDTGWGGFRPFTVVKRVSEDAAGQICSFYLEPQDGQALPTFRPGQFLTFRVEVPAGEGGGTETLTRCYSLSDAPRPGHYRVSIKRVLPPTGSAWPPGRSSGHFHDHVQVGATLQVRAPSGHFHLAADDSPVVLIAGGIGVTPILSMLEWAVAHQPGREVWCYYGVRNGREAAFVPRLRALAAECPGVRLRLCFSDPRPEDRPDADFHVCGRVEAKLLRMELPLKPYHFYVCGPSPMMTGMVSGLTEWGVPESRIHYEAFGPASIRRPAAADLTVAAAGADGITVTFARTGREARWTAADGSLLEFAEAQGVAVDSGCRAGGCGTCQTTIRTGEVAYRQTPDHDPEPGTCLLCVCTPKNDLTLEA